MRVLATGSLPGRVSVVVDSWQLPEVSDVVVVRNPLDCHVLVTGEVLLESVWRPIPCREFGDFWRVPRVPEYSGTPETARVLWHLAEVPDTSGILVECQTFLAVCPSERDVVVGITRGLWQLLSCQKILAVLGSRKNKRRVKIVDWVSGVVVKCQKHLAETEVPETSGRNRRCQNLLVPDFGRSPSPALRLGLLIFGRETILGSR